jgi:hypothetical protein
MIAKSPAILLLLLALTIVGCQSQITQDVNSWQPLFDGKTMTGWIESPFGGHEETHVEDGNIILDFGAAEISGVTCTQPVPTNNYEISLEAMRLSGNDFFCGLTFPVDDQFCTFIVGGWGGTVVGLSSVNGYDASDNETSTYAWFDNKKWYYIKVRVTSEKIQAWIDYEKVVDFNRTGKKLSIRGEVQPSRPLGIAAWNTRAALRNIKIKYLTPNPKMIQYTPPPGM